MVCWHLRPRLSRLRVWRTNEKSNSTLQPLH
jgi:hypothetical protein